MNRKKSLSRMGEPERRPRENRADCRQLPGLRLPERYARDLGRLQLPSAPVAGSDLLRLRHLPQGTTELQPGQKKNLLPSPVPSLGPPSSPLCHFAGLRVRSQLDGSCGLANYATGLVGDADPTWGPGLSSSEGHLSPQVDAEQYYSELEEQLTDEFNAELNRVRLKRLDLIFVTFNDFRMAKR